jgi:hypothetical protein
MKRKYLPIISNNYSKNTIDDESFFRDSVTETTLCRGSAPGRFPASAAEEKSARRAALSYPYLHTIIYDR